MRRTSRHRLLGLIGAALIAAGCGGPSVSLSADPGSTSVVQSPEAQLASIVDEALAIGKRRGKYTDLERGDLLALALVPAAGALDVHPWGVPDYALGHARGESTFGPWGMTLDMARVLFGAEYGVDQRWSDDEVAIFLTEKPLIQTQIAADRLQRFYTEFGPRSPYALQSWRVPSIPPEAEAWRREMSLLDERSSFAREVLVGTPEEPRGILYWQAGDESMKEALESWRSMPAYVWMPGQPAPRRTDGRFSAPINPRDLQPMKRFRSQYATAHRLVTEVLASPEPIR